MKKHIEDQPNLNQPNTECPFCKGTGVAEYWDVDKLFASVKDKPLGSYDVSHLVDIGTCPDCIKDN